MHRVNLRTASRPLPGGTVLRLGLYLDSEERPLLAVLAIGGQGGGVEDLVDPRQRDRIVLPASALEVLPELLEEVCG